MLQFSELPACSLLRQLVGNQSLASDFNTSFACAGLHMVFHPEERTAKRPSVDVEKSLQSMNTGMSASGASSSQSSSHPWVAPDLKQAPWRKTKRGNTREQFAERFIVIRRKRGHYCHDCKERFGFQGVTVPYYGNHIRKTW